MFARLAVNIPSVSAIFDYSLSENLEQVVLPGCLVTVPFGKQLVQGVVLELVSQPAVAETKQVIDLLDPSPVLTAAQLSLAKWLSGETFNFTGGLHRDDAAIRVESAGRCSLHF